MKPALANDCFVHDRQRLRHGEALAILRSRVRPVTGIETVPLDAACGRILAEPVVAPRDVPAHTNAAVDGYAFAHADYDAERGAALRVAARIAAGDAGPHGLPPGCAARIFTGAVMPHGADTVAMQEDVETHNDGAETVALIPAGLNRGANRRLAGEDMKAGETVLARGLRLRPQDIAAAAACGLGSLACHAPLLVGVFSSGEEIIRPGETFRAGKVFDANAPMLKALGQASGFRCDDLGILPDRAETVSARLSEVARSYDALITTGGASRGEEDHLALAVRSLGSLHLWQLAIKPGRPMAFGQIGDCAVLVLPGNPVAAFVCFLIYARPVLMALAGADWPEPRRFPLPADFEIAARKTGRREFWRARTHVAEGGVLMVRKYERDGSGLISSLRDADGLIDMAEDVEEVRRGDMVPFMPFSEFGL